MKKILLLLLCIILAMGTIGLSACSESDDTDDTDTTTESDDDTVDLTDHTLNIYCGAGMTDPFTEIYEAFEKETGCEVNVTFENASQIQTQITTSEEGDIFIAGSADELEPVEDYVEDSISLVKHIPVLAVAEGNPENITGLEDLASDDIELVIGDVDSTPIGKIAKKALTALDIYDTVNIEATTTTAPQLATLIASGDADAAIVWKENCDVDGVEIVDTTDLDDYVKTVPAASLTTAEDEDAVEAFLEFLESDTAQDIWTSYGYEIVE